jgi:hypothetical protein
VCFDRGIKVLEFLIPTITGAFTVVIPSHRIIIIRVSDSILNILLKCTVVLTEALCLPSRAVPNRSQMIAEWQGRPLSYIEGSRAASRVLIAHSKTR